jgi:predicted component of type VI protein secretion system
MEIRPFEAVGSLLFGDVRSAVREKLGMEYSSFSKTTGDEPTDAYDSLGLHLYYDEDGRLEFVEAFIPAVITMDGITFLGRQVADVVR